MQGLTVSGVIILCIRYFVKSIDLYFDSRDIK